MKQQRNRPYRRSKQRESILQLLRSVKSHPTADWIYLQLKEKYPRLSLGTVYRNLSVLMDQGLVRKFNCGDTFDRFDANVMPHYHFICEQCHRTFDFDMPIEQTLLEKAQQFNKNFSITAHRVDFMGICDQCKKKNR